MSFDFEALQKRLAGVSLDEVTKYAESTTKDNSKAEDDEADFWKPTLENGNAQAIVRFLPPLPGEAPWIEYIDFFFKGPTGKWYVNKSLETFGWESDPAGDWVKEQYDNHEGKDMPPLIKKYNARRRYQFVTNIYVIKDYNNPENDGKVFKYRFPKTIKNTILSAMKPEYEGDTPINPFDPTDNGANFEFRIYSKFDPQAKKSYPQYDKCAFKSPGALTENMEEMGEILSQVHSLASFVDRSTFKTYDQLKSDFDRVMGINAGSAGREQEQSSVGRESENSLTSSEEDDYDNPPFDMDDGDDDGDESSSAMDLFKKAAAES